MDKIILSYVFIILLVIFIGLIIYDIYSKKKTYNQLRDKYKEKLNAEQIEVANKLAKLQEEYFVIEEEYKKEYCNLQEVIKELQEKQHFNQQLYKIREEELDKLIETKKNAELEKVDKEVNEWAESAQEAAAFYAEQVQKAIQKDIENGQKELNSLTSIIDDYKARRDVINQEILRARAIEEQQDFYRVQLPESSKHDLEILQSIRQELTKVDILDKLLYDNYVKKPVEEMVKRVLKGDNPSGIYKITRLKTGEIYIGKSVNIKDRWIQHAKSCYHCGTISHSTLHTTMEKDGIENFTWELLEEIPKDKLSEREKYWIEFYDTKNFGLNERQG